MRLVSEIDGNMEYTFKKIARKTSYEGSKEDAINQEELQEVLSIMIGIEVPPDQVKKIFDELDNDHSGYIEFPEFKNWYTTSELKAMEQCKVAPKFFE